MRVYFQPFLLQVEKKLKIIPLYPICKLKSHKMLSPLRLWINLATRRFADLITLK